MTTDESSTRRVEPRCATRVPSGSDRFLRVALVSYRGNPRSGGQGVYVRQLTRALTLLGHSVTVFSGQPYPELFDTTRLVRVPSLDLYREPEPFRTPHPREIRTVVDALELATMWTGGFPEPRTFSLRVRDEILSRRREFDVVHDNQCLGPGISAISRAGLAVIASIHHPVVIDKELELEQAEGALRRLSLRRWYGFSTTQARTARSLLRIITVSSSSARDITARMGVESSRIGVVPVGVDATCFRPLPEVARMKGRIMTTTSSDLALKGLTFLLEALAKLRVEREDAHLLVVGSLRRKSEIPKTIERLSLEGAVRFVTGVKDEEIVRLYAQSEVAVVPSLYEGFSLPAIEAMACAVPLVATTGGALPEVVGANKECALLVPPGDPSALCQAISEILASPELARRIGRAGRCRVEEKFTWDRCASKTVDEYERVIEEATC